MGSLGMWEIVALAVLALLIFGPDRLPGIARTVGQTISKLKVEANKTMSELREAAGVDDDIAQLAREAKDLSSSLKDVKKSTAGALMSGVTAVNEATSLEKPKSPGGPTEQPRTLAYTPGAAPFDPDAT